jgi:DNA repair protein RadC
MTEASDRPRHIYRITDLSQDDRPRERLAALGPTALSKAELIAILLRVGVPGENAVQVGQRILDCFGGLAGLHRASLDELTQQHGIGAAKAAQLKAAIELGRRLAAEAPEERATINSPEDAANLVRYEMSGFEDEHLRVILLNTRNQVLGNPQEIYHGSVNTSQVRVGEVFKDAVRRNATALIPHNHQRRSHPQPRRSGRHAPASRPASCSTSSAHYLVIGQGRTYPQKNAAWAFLSIRFGRRLGQTMCWVELLMPSQMKGLLI